MSLDFLGADVVGPTAPGDGQGKGTPPAIEPYDWKEGWFKKLPEDLQDAALVGFPIQIVDTAARAEHTILNTDKVELGKVFRKAVVDRKTHPDMNPPTLKPFHMMTDARDRMLKRRSSG